MFTTFPFLHHCGRNVRFTPENDFGSAKGILLRARSRHSRMKQKDRLAAVSL